MIGRLGNARVTLLPGEPAEDGSPTWRMLLQEAKPKDPAAKSATSPSQPRRAKSAPHMAKASGAALPDDSISELWARE
jgi:hypothetical protein